MRTNSPSGSATAPHMPARRGQVLRPVSHRRAALSVGPRPRSQPRAALTPPSTDSLFFFTRKGTSSVAKGQVLWRRVRHQPPPVWQVLWRRVEYRTAVPMQARPDSSSGLEPACRLETSESDQWPSSVTVAKRRVLFCHGVEWSGYV